MSSTKVLRRDKVPKEQKLRYSVTQKNSCNDIRGIMKAQVDSGPCDEASKNEKDGSIFGKPGGQESGHHECIDSMAAWEAGINNFSWTFQES